MIDLFWVFVFLLLEAVFGPKVPDFGAKFLFFVINDGCLLLKTCRLWLKSGLQFKNRQRSHVF